MVSRPFQGATFKVLGIALLALLMLIPLGQVNSLVFERSAREQEATQQIAEGWGGAQIVGAPVLVVPVEYTHVYGKVTSTSEEREYVLADRAAFDVTLATDVRSYGIYRVPVYTSSASVEGRFRADDLAALGDGGGKPQWDRAELRVAVADVRHIRSVSAIHFGEHDSAFEPGSEGIGRVSAITAPVPFGGPKGNDPVPFSFKLTLAGTERFAVLPLARDTDLRVTSAWPDPGFNGAFLPTERRVDATGFEAAWRVLDLNRPLAQHWTQRDNESVGNVLSTSSFGVTLTQPADSYQRNVRAGKYGALFIALTFVAFFLFEVLRSLRVHPVQYLLVGAALSTFYVVLLALSEQVGFAIAYAIAAAAVVLMVGGYAGVVLAGRRAGITLGALLAFIYALLYGLVAREDYALLMGSIALLATVAALMYLTRRVNWYALGPAEAR